jgi:hypothetical protein
MQILGKFNIDKNNQLFAYKLSNQFVEVFYRSFIVFKKLSQTL